MQREFVKGLASVIVPVYNVKPYLRECLDSIVNQTYKDLEIVVIDNESNDGGEAICDEYAERDERIKVIHRPHGCVVSFPRNTGLEVVRGEYCFFVDSDDWLDLHTIEMCVKKFDSNASTNIIAFGVPHWVLSKDDNTWKPDKYVFQYSEEKFYHGHEIFDLFITGKLLPAPWQRAYRTSLIQDLRFIEQAGVVEDGPFLLELCQKPDLGLLTLPYRCYNYRWLRPGALTNKSFYIWAGSLQGLEYVLDKPTFSTLPLETKIGSIMLIASYLREYLIAFYGRVNPKLPMTDEDQKFYGVLLRFQNLIKSHRSLLPWNVDGLIARVLISYPPERVKSKIQWIERFMRVLHIPSKLYRR